jgi:hypothetical protein
MRKLLEFAASLLLIPLTVSFGYETYSFLVANVSFSLIDSFLYGCLAYGLIHLALGHRMIFIRIFEHELGHTLAAFALFRSVQKFEVNPEEGGGFVGVGGLNFIIRLAPYYLPVFTIPLLFVKPFVLVSMRNMVNFLIGFTLAFHYLSLLIEFRRDQPDIQESGLFFSFCVTFIMNAAILVVILCAVLDDYSPLPGYARDSFVTAFEFSRAVLRRLSVR